MRASTLPTRPRHSSSSQWNPTIRQQHIKALLLTTPHAGREVYIPRFDTTPGDEKTRGYTFTRRQFPVRLCFAMTINKAQGQTLDKVLIESCWKKPFDKNDCYFDKTVLSGKDFKTITLAGRHHPPQAALLARSTLRRPVPCPQPRLHQALPLQR